MNSDEVGRILTRISSFDGFCDFFDLEQYKNNYSSRNLTDSWFIAKTMPSSSTEDFFVNELEIFNWKVNKNCFNYGDFFNDPRSENLIRDLDKMYLRWMKFVIASRLRKFRELNPLADEWMKLITVIFGNVLENNNYHFDSVSFNIKMKKGECSELLANQTPNTFLHLSDYPVFLDTLFGFIAKKKDFKVADFLKEHNSYYYTVRFRDFFNKFMHGDQDYLDDTEMFVELAAENYGLSHLSYETKFEILKPDNFQFLKKAMVFEEEKKNG